MSRIDASIESDRSKNRVVVLSSAVLLIIALSSYLVWLFLIEGFTVAVTPEQAGKSAHYQVDNGTGFFIDNKLYVLSLPVKITVGAPKYQSESVIINSDAPSTIAVGLTPKPATVRLSTSENEEQIEWLVNDTPYATAESIEISLPPGTHSVTARHPSYETARLRLETEIAQKIEKIITLTPISGTLDLRSAPNGAEVLVNGKSVGKTPINLAYAGGSHDVKIQLEGYEPVNDSISLTANQPVARRDYQLIPVQATLNIQTQPAQGLLTVNSKTVSGTTMSIDANTEHVISFSAPGYQTQRKTITVAPGKSATLMFDLAPQTGKVNITANLPAEVYIDGQKAGETPLTTDLQTLAHTIEVKKAGYRTISQKITPTVDRLTSVNAKLLTEFAARRKEGRPLFAETIGISLIMLNPDTVQVGSAPNEVGRQRNEHQYTVQFTRPFWLSRHEITEAQFARFSGQNGGSEKPVTGVSWLDAARFTNWLSEQEGLPSFYIIENGRLRGIDPASNGYRLPTEAEWEFAAKQNRRAAATKYVWGSQDRLRDKQGNFADESLKGKQTFILKDYKDGFTGKAPVGSFKAERGGFFDLDGNVREWVHDFYTVLPPESDSISPDYRGSTPTSSHVVKGASFKTGRLKRLRASMRTGESEPQDDIGFRIARYQN